MFVISLTKCLANQLLPRVKISWIKCVFVGVQRFNDGIDVEDTTTWKIFGSEKTVHWRNLCTVSSKKSAETAGGTGGTSEHSGFSSSPNDQISDLSFETQFERIPVSNFHKPEFAVGCQQQRTRQQLSFFYAIGFQQKDWKKTKKKKQHHRLCLRT